MLPRFGRGGIVEESTCEVGILFGDEGDGCLRQVGGGRSEGLCLLFGTGGKKCRACCGPDKMFFHGCKMFEMVNEYGFSSVRDFEVCREAARKVRAG